MRHLALGVFLLTASLVSAADVQKLTLTSRAKERTYYLFVPDHLDAAGKSPLLIALHGSGRNGKSQVDQWKDFAAKNGIVVAAPDSLDSKVWVSPEDGPQLLYDLTETLKAKYPIDGRRVYLFGHSAGACFALQIGLLQSEYFAAVAIHAGALQPAAMPLTKAATRKIPFALFVGTKDPYFPVAEVRKTRDALVADGMTAEVTEIPGHNHDYYARSRSINESAWKFMSEHALSSEPKYTRYSNL